MRSSGKHPVAVRGLAGAVGEVRVGVRLQPAKRTGSVCTTLKLDPKYSKMAVNSARDPRGDQQ